MLILYYNHSIAYHPLMFNNNNIDSYFNFSMHKMRFIKGNRIDGMIMGFHLI